MDTPLKLQMARNFSRAAPTYDLWAEAHRRIAGHLVKLLEQLPRHPAAIIELGCGTGVLSDPLLRRFPAARFHGLDLAPGMIRVCQERWGGRRNASFAVADMEADPLPFSPDLFASSCVLQWVADLPALSRRLAAALPANGMLALAELSRGSTPELAMAWEALGRGPFPGLAYREPGRLGRDLEDSGFRLLHVETGKTTVWYPDALAALHSFKGIGALLPAGPAPLAVGQTRSLVARYGELFHNEQGEVPVTYHVTYVLATTQACGGQP